ncbi:hypothetical protein KIPB_008561 [Kipferlia bialata]|uniref:Uncharacterized protein n=1 Tax=Kipferlia bialata TaxID=797122 RepID=A0A9K3GKU7_9EUKA|nr:hypothetical protein KIPB_008561 [Kipferlia bialata]|eukprot:g8561.t1
MSVKPSRRETFAARVYEAHDLLATPTLPGNKLSAFLEDILCYGDVTTEDMEGEGEGERHQVKTNPNSIPRAIQTRVLKAFSHHPNEPVSYALFYRVVLLVANLRAMVSMCVAYFNATQQKGKASQRGASLIRAHVGVAEERGVLYVAPSGASLDQEFEASENAAIIAATDGASDVGAGHVFRERDYVLDRDQFICYVCEGVLAGLDKKLYQLQVFFEAGSEKPFLQVTRPAPIRPAGTVPMQPAGMAPAPAPLQPMGMAPPQLTASELEERERINAGVSLPGMGQ